MNKHVTAKQAEKLKLLGFNESVVRHRYTPNYSIYAGHFRTNGEPRNWNKYTASVSVPTVDEAVDWLRRKYNIHIYTCIEPFVDPNDPKGSVLYRYGAKWCDRRNGWNGRLVIGKTNLSKNPYSLKRQAITFALRWITKNNVKKLSK